MTEFFEGEYAEKFPDYLYRVPIPCQEIINLEDILRVYNDKEFPRYTDVSASHGDLKVVSRVDYYFVKTERQFDTKVEMFLKCNQYTLAKRDLKICEMILPLYNEYFDECKYIILSRVLK